MTRGCGLAMKGAVRFMERSVATRQSMSFGCHCERSAAIHAGMKSWIATACGLNGMDAPTLNRHQMCQSGYLNNHFNEKERPT